MPGQKWEDKHSSLVSIVPTREFVAVFAIECEDGSYRLVTHALDALAVSNTTVERMIKEEGVGVRSLDKHVVNEVVGLYVGNCDDMAGEFQVANHKDGFAGLCRLGEDISAYTTFLPRHILEKLKKQPDS